MLPDDLLHLAQGLPAGDALELGDLDDAFHHLERGPFVGGRLPAVSRRSLRFRERLLDLVEIRRDTRERSRAPLLQDHEHTRASVGDLPLEK